MTNILYRCSKTVAIITTVFSSLLFTKANAQWSELGGLNGLAANGHINFITTDKVGNVYANGDFKNKSGNSYIAKYDKNTNTWSELGGVDSFFTLVGTSSATSIITTDVLGNVYVAGGFSYTWNGVLSGVNTSFEYDFVAKWDGKSWSKLKTDTTYSNNKVSTWFPRSINTICTDATGNLYGAGSCLKNGSNNPYYYVAKWNGIDWIELGGDSSSFSSVLGTITCISTDNAGNLYASGSRSIGDSIHVAEKWDGSKWITLGSGELNGKAQSIAIDASKNIYLGGTFSNNGNFGVIEYNGNNWSGSYSKNPVYSIISDSSGTLYAGYNNYVVKYSGGNWNVLGNSNSLNSFIFSIATDYDSNLFAAGAFTNANGNEYVAKYNPTGLPVKLENLSAIQENEDIAINWRTATELNTSHFIIQHSTDGNSFTTIGTVKAIGTGANSYNFTDNKPINDINYYRLQSVDKDGNSTFSKVVSANFGDKQSFSITPNPARDFVTISFSKLVDKATVAVYDITGKAVIAQSLSGSTNNSYKLNTQTLTNGVYVVKVNTATSSYNEKLLINK